MVHPGYAEFMPIPRVRSGGFTRESNTVGRFQIPSGVAHDRVAAIHPTSRRARAMSTLLLWLLIVAVAAYLVVAMLRPDKF
jgi:K+-transporting ATPase KdpF subunit